MDSDQQTQGVLKDFMIFQKTRTTNLADVKALNMWGYELEDISVISGLVNAETISLPINKIRSLYSFQGCKNIQNLLLRQNLISDFSELRYLSDLPYLTNLTLSDNPIAQLPNYRETVIHSLPQIKKLDDIPVSVVFTSEAYSIGGNTNSTNNNIGGYYRDVDDSKSIILSGRSENPNTMKKQFNIMSKVKQNTENKYSALRNSLNLTLPKKNHQQQQSHQSHSQYPSQNLNPNNIDQNQKYDDSHLLTAVLSLIPELSVDSLQIVLEAIHNQCV